MRFAMGYEEASDPPEELIALRLSRAACFASVLLLLAAAAAQLVSGLSARGEDDSEAYFDEEPSGRFAWLSLSSTWVALAGVAFLLLLGEGLALLARWHVRTSTLRKGSYCITLDRSEVRLKLGLDVDHTGARFVVGRKETWTLLPVLSLSPESLVEQWNNTAKASQQVSPGDHIVEINGAWAEASQMVERVRQDKVLRIRLARGAPTRYLLRCLSRVREEQAECRSATKQSGRNSKQPASAFDETRYPWLKETRRQSASLQSPSSGLGAGGRRSVEGSGCGITLDLEAPESLPPLRRLLSAFWGLVSKAKRS
eukprot:TRINITY_DN27257_c0_g1_i1.p1 TRINITY_DN27257_c0_g1~~TRINITY_DN27257_c0_g1_i1.p1  ORF type:complete len:313 (+),score=58.36 TRINITY_DN27257_c0_g1_i1:51-989(+)